jgi:hypothetical protein
MGFVGDEIQLRDQGFDGRDLRRPAALRKGLCLRATDNGLSVIQEHLIFFNLFLLNGKWTATASERQIDLGIR